MAPGIADKKNNSLPLWGNEKTMNLNNLILTNILSSHYFKVNLYQLKTYHEVIDEIYFQVTHLEPWEKGSRKTSGNSGMCGGVRGVGAGGIVSTAFSILYKLFTLKLTRKQVVGLINHRDSPYIRGLGFMYIRYTQPPADLWAWYEPYLDDEEQIDVKAGGGQLMTIGEMLCHYLGKLEWFSTLFPRIPVPIQKDLERKLSNWRRERTDNKSKICEESAEIYMSETHPDEPEDNDNHCDEEFESGKNSPYPPEPKVKDSAENIRLRDDLAEEKEKRDKDRQHGKTLSSKHHHSSERHKNHSSYRCSIRARSRSPLNSKSHKDEELKRHKTKHRDTERSSEHSRHRERSHSSHRKDSDSDYEKFPKDKKHSHDRKESKRSIPYSHSHEKRHNHVYSRNRNRY